MCLFPTSLIFLVFGLRPLYFPNVIIADNNADTSWAIPSCLYIRTPSRYNMKLFPCFFSSCTTLDTRTHSRVNINSVFSTFFFIINYKKISNAFEGVFPSSKSFKIWFLTSSDGILYFKTLAHKMS
ncbi:uncharacterized protein LOC126554013 [Aphis gossypii]|uniref:uncharacterized protein LOC126554013 n=1 Tax=Aphis gossypii TaxID=80765 RepID=UPI0021599C5F|nr:uncharacterized protein LOC126554013 [Aphis gossypii]